MSSDRKPADESDELATKADNGETVPNPDDDESIAKARARVRDLESSAGSD